MTDALSPTFPPGGRTMLITGANGFIGSRLAGLAMAEGYAVRTLTRSDWGGAPAVPVEGRYLGSLPWRIPAEALAGVDVVVHCAASVDGTGRSAHAVNVDGTARLAGLAREAGVKTFIFLSSQSARPDAVSAYGKTKYAAEQALLGESGLSVVILRPGLVVGTGAGGLFRRLARTVDTLPVIPLLGGGRAIVQPVHVDDLCAAIFRCDGAAGLDRAILRLGDPVGVSLAEFLQRIALARRGRRKPALSIPLWPVEIAVRIAEALRIPLPIGSGTLKAMKIVERMDTAGDLARLGVRARPLDEMLREEPGTPAPVSLKDRAVRVLLVGAGRIGLVHAVTLSRLRGAVLAGVAEPNPKARRLLRGMGVSAPMFGGLDEAMAGVRPDAAVIATPVATHLPLTRACLARGLAVMVEKPLAICAEELAEYQRLASEFPDHPVQVGYVMPRNPQVSASLARLRAGEFGRVRRFVGLTLLSLVEQPGVKRWEVVKSLSGGGALINAGGHVLSMIHAAFGDPRRVEAQHLKLNSTEVEDSLVATFTYGDFRGTHYCSWSIKGYPRQENLLTVWTDEGRLILTGSVAVFVRDDGETEITHQLDAHVGFNIAPDYAGAGFTTELGDLAEAARTGRSAPMSLAEAIRLERLLFSVYDASREVTRFSETGAPAERRLHPKPWLAGVASRPGPDVRRVLDLRDLSTGSVGDVLEEVARGSPWAEFLLSALQVRGLPGRWRRGERLRVTVPDFLGQSRLLSNGRHAVVLRQMGAGGVVAAARAALPLGATERGATFWVAAMGMLGAGLHAVPRDFEGTLLLHTYLTDFALSVRRLDVLERMLATCRRLRPRARVGFHTNMAAEALSALPLLDARVDEVSVLTSPRAVNMAATLGAMRSAVEGLSLTAEVGLAPDVVHRVAGEAPEHWALGADAVLVGAAAHPALAARRGGEIAQEWARVFPGLRLPEEMPC